MQLTDREKFIAHYLSVTIIGMLDNQPRNAMEKVIEHLRSTRTRKITQTEATEIIEHLNDEFVNSGALLNHKRRELNDEWK
tara:strand:- start:1853 stop:2095 length:243 start_codon:yes stop_codon:yes gene_type:complete